MQVTYRRADIDSAQDFFVFCRDHYTKHAEHEEHPHYRRMVFFVSTEDIPRDRVRNTALKPLSKTRQQHCVKMVQPFVVSYRERSCFCGACLGNGEGGMCAMSDITGDWNVVHLQKGPRGRQKNSRICAFMFDDQN